MRYAVSDLQVKHKYSNVTRHFTMSIGIATCTPDENIEPYDLVRRADEKLYEAKKGGRKRVEAANYEK
jgi:diguanylate cyclase (GGDEF)-like protein